jgi:hypothetical protein
MGQEGKEDGEKTAGKAPSRPRPPGVASNAPPEAGYFAHRSRNVAESKIE